MFLSKCMDMPQHCRDAVAYFYVICYYLFKKKDKEKMNMSKKYILFDLDGTLTDSGEGIIKSVQYALESVGIHEERMDVLHRYIGPPLDFSFEKFHGMTGDDNKAVVAKYRQRYGEVGLFENKVYDGIIDVLKTLQKRGYILAVATCKPEKYMVPILEHFKLTPYFTVMVGCDLEGGQRRHKHEVIEEVFRQLNEKLNGGAELTEEVLDDMKAEALMVGDRNNDILGAKECQIESLGVRYGYAEPEELEDAGADYIVDSVVEIVAAIEQM